jgi:DNA polymerase
MTHILTVDFETYYDRNYSLSKMTNEEYVRSPLFEAIGVSVKVNDGPAEWFSGDKYRMQEFLNTYNWNDAIAVAHNAVFDASILAFHFGTHPKMIACTMSMAKAINGASVSGALGAQVAHYELGVKGQEVAYAINKHRRDFSRVDLAKYGAYCCNDTDLTYDLFLRLLEGGFPSSEAKLIDMTIRMATEPKLLLDKQKLADHYGNVIEAKSDLIAEIQKIQGAAGSAGKDDVMKNARLAGLLSSLGVAPPMKLSKTTGREIYAFAKTDEEFVDLLEHPDPKVQAVVGARLGVKSTLEETRTKRLMDMADRGPMPVALRYYAAHTGRWGGDGKINLQNLPRKSPIRDAIKAPPGYVIVDGDSSQIEARVLAWIAGQWDLVEAFANGEDVYKIMAASIYGVPLEEVTPLMRFVGKTTVLGCGYGLGPDRFKAALKNSTPSVDMPRNECERIIHVYRRRYPAIPELWDQGKSAISAMVGDRSCPFGEHNVLEVMGAEGIRLPNGLFLKYPNLRWEEPEEGARPEFRYDLRKGQANTVNRLYGGKLVENGTQALARIIIGEQALAIQKRYPVVLTVHDAVAALVPEKERAEGEAFVAACLRTRPKWAPDLPLNCEVGSGKSYGDCKS